VAAIALVIASIVVAVIGVPLAASMYLVLLAIWVSPLIRGKVQLLNGC
jgi:hypothetical protein